ncbi:PTS sugar transporter subunit IIA [Candidatus Enterococcus mangumiae]|uniref:Ascorbate-specific PTS system EIIA component n=1 Tax=Candidatus Enterococcus mangumiae TaxID=2230878 RepID=A0ABZ2SSX2_9ENTE|nr:PTS sugar transporter subunit IIA [Enterococcus sp. DIV1094]MBO0488742.1 PTS sugar transporter subunit IIA [Enterococcus sp. DIV1094]
MLRYFYENGLVNYVETEIDDWRVAIEESGRLLLEKGIVAPTYIEKMIRCVEEYGTYILIAPHVAMPHAMQGNSNVFDTAIAFTKMKVPVSFEDDSKSASLFFTLAAKEPEQHLSNIQSLSELLMQEGLIQALLATESLEDYQVVMEEYDQA